MIDGIRGRRQPGSLPARDTTKFAHPARGNNARAGFTPPAEVAAAEEQNEGTATIPPAAQPAKKRSCKQWLHSLSKKQKIAGTIVAAIVAAGAIIGAYFLFFSPEAPVSLPVAQKQVTKEAPKPTTVASTLTGLQVDPAVNDRPVTAIMIENSLDARPQSGLNQAGVVFEAVAEGGITRFLTLFQDTEPDYIGPVRSVRPYYIQWALGFDAAIAHAGGSPQGLAGLTQWGAKDLNHANGYFWRVNNRAAPHNLYTSIAELHKYEAAKGYGKSTFTSLSRKAEQPSTAPTAKSINFNISSANFAVHYDYDATTNSYKRSEGGAAHTDEKSGAQLTPKVVVALVVPQGISGQYTTYTAIGSGQVSIFQDGNVQTGSWKKDSNNAQFTFTDNNGAEIKLNPGQTWFTALGSADRITYTP